ncbi:similar to Saccharomyces cerevisiae YDR247W VHS1 Cytoplasmic serine/threonine protein kinase [Maudiozyma barnettii]|uniref:non-specific serine/threonine protein kinase n=1 Tax=Maudiozyma barnettii TaxID=61262 RepID=A0A8H2ZHU0_9SACH|nr:uncharacterized protein KABA2_05S09724 [Kazachstania barnettii]CAB4255158.1 similar to Saccharomyces cerevisiae YDR247W VHS1 Cytoplasmic serine/threonine protein kinase [Kazachstania barnettii]CAD1783429.1 similar to Saccharomyces cerevisiae YDR247W VHS1 Cytoplasmic serine/threonine protein kinase [Kazachstania barnettii]
MFENCMLNNYKIIKTLGSGAYGIVFLAIDITTGKEYAIKAILKVRHNIHSSDDSNKCSKILHKYLLQLLYRDETRLPLDLPLLDLDLIQNMTTEDLLKIPYFKELSFQLRVHQHANIVTIHEAMDSAYISFMVMDYYSKDLFTSIVDEQHFANDGTLIKRVFLQLCSALQYCHERGISHCDMKPENLLLDNDNNLYICDFGLSSTDKALKKNISVGSPYYMAPERLHVIDSACLEYPTLKSDIWSLGIILINLACMRNPWLKAHQLQDKTFRHFVSNPSVLKKLLPISESFFDLLIQILQINPLERKDIHNLMYDVAQLDSFTLDGPLCAVDIVEFEIVGANYRIENSNNNKTNNIPVPDAIETVFSSGSSQTLFDMDYEKSEIFGEPVQSTCTSEEGNYLVKDCVVNLIEANQH